MYITVIGDNIDPKLPLVAKEISGNAFLVDNTNYKDFLKNKINEPTVIYTSLGDLPKDLNVIAQILYNSKEIVYCPSTEWADKKTIDPLAPTDSVQGLTESILLHMANFTKVSNLDLCYEQKYDMPRLDTRKSDRSQLWIAGCSVSHGIGVELHERYGHLLGKTLNLETNFLTIGGASITWTAGEILKSDLRHGDIVVWGVTAGARLSLFHKNKLNHIIPTSYKTRTDLNLFSILPADLLDSENTLYQSLNAITQVINFCEKLNVELVLFNALSDNRIHRLLAKFTQYHHYSPSYTSISPSFIDYGNDNEHPGPLTHQQYSDFLAQIIKK